MTVIVKKEIIKWADEGYLKERLKRRSSRVIGGGDKGRKVD